MDTEKMIRELRRLEKKHKDDKVGTCENNWSVMCHDVANRLEELNNIVSKLYNLEREGYVLTLDEEKDGVSVETLLPIKDVLGY